MDVDEATGLPKVPEGFFWQVIERFYSGSNYAMIALIQKVETVYSGYNYNFLFFKWGRYEYSRSDYNPVCEEFLYYSDIEVPDDVDKHVRTVEIGDKKEMKKVFLVKPYEVTPLLIFEAAERALVKHNRKLAAQKLYGQYPPNNIEAYRV